MNFKNKNFISIFDFSREELEYLINKTINLKKSKKNKTEKKHLIGKNIGFYFDKPSTRTRLSFEVSTADQGGFGIYLTSKDIHLGVKESIYDTVKVMERMLDAITIRLYDHKKQLEFAKYSKIPIINMMSSEEHPTQTLADLMTIYEHKGKLDGLKITFVGGGKQNSKSKTISGSFESWTKVDAVTYSLIAACLKFNMHVTLLVPKELFLEGKFLEKLKNIKTNGSLKLTSDIDEGVENSDVLYGKTSIFNYVDGEIIEKNWDLLKKYLIDMKIIKKAKKDVIFMHCLPLTHNLDTLLGKKIEKLKNIKNAESVVTDEVFMSKYSVVFDEAENRLHTIKALLIEFVN